jgi:hypothetical protein
MTREDLKPGTKVVHKKGGMYTILGIAKAAWDAKQELVVYICDYENPEGKMWVRSVTEFLDGRFSLPNN